MKEMISYFSRIGDCILAGKDIQFPLAWMLQSEDAKVYFTGIYGGFHISTQTE